MCRSSHQQYCHQPTPPAVGKSGRTAVWQNSWQSYPPMVGQSGRTTVCRTAGSPTPTKGWSVWQNYCSPIPPALVLEPKMTIPYFYLLYPINKKRPIKLISVKSMAIYLKIPYYFYTNLNFQRPISHLILIWDPLKLYHFWTLQIKLSNFGRSPSHRMGFGTKNDHSLLLSPLSNKQKQINKQKKAYKAYFCEIYGHLLKNSLLFLYKMAAYPIILCKLVSKTNTRVC